MELEIPSQMPDHKFDQRPWGDFLQLTDNEVSTVKILHVLPGKRLSLQSHSKRSEYWRVLEGEMEVQVGDSIIRLKQDEEVFIPIETKHRVTGLEQKATWLEISYGLFDESDIVRYEDDFGRA